LVVTAVVVDDDAGNDVPGVDRVATTGVFVGFVVAGVGLDTDDVLRDCLVYLSEAIFFAHTESDGVSGVGSIATDFDFSGSHGWTCG